ncbi:MAG: hypothetical protein QM731_01305 [Chitinophagaceae bacterium]
MARIITIVSLILLLTTGCHTAAIMQTVSDAPKLKEQDSFFIGKPLRTLLKEIGPRIRMAYGEGQPAHHDALSYFIFKFITHEELTRYNTANKKPLSIIVYIKERFEWDRLSRPLKQRFTWTKKDEQQYGELTIVNFRIYGDLIQ